MSRSVSRDDYIDRLCILEAYVDDVEFEDPSMDEELIKVLKADLPPELVRTAYVAKKMCLDQIPSYSFFQALAEEEGAESVDRRLENFKNSNSQDHHLNSDYHETDSSTSLLSPIKFDNNKSNLNLNRQSKETQSTSLLSDPKDHRHSKEQSELNNNSVVNGKTITSFGGNSVFQYHGSQYKGDTMADGWSGF